MPIPTELEETYDNKYLYAYAQCPLCLQKSFARMRLSYLTNPITYQNTKEIITFTISKFMDTHFEMDHKII